jgi:hypothetical protein
VKPTHFAQEPGKWRPWPAWAPAPLPTHLAQRDTSPAGQALFRISQDLFTVVIYVHALRYESGEWNCRTGWKQPTPHTDKETS